MSDQDPPDQGGRRRRLEGVIPELLKRAIEIGVDKATGSPESLKHFVGDLKLPKEIASYLLTQVDETKNGLFRVVAKEIREFLEHTNIAAEMQRMLTTVQFEINTTVRFSPNDVASSSSSGNAPGDPNAPKGDTKPQPMPKPEVKTQVNMKRDEPRRERRRPRE